MQNLKIFSVALVFMTSSLAKISAQQAVVANQTCVSGNCINGKGKLVYPNGDTYEGDFVNGSLEGEGVFIYVNYGVYQGQFSKNVRNGSGSFAFKTGDSYQGNWTNDKRDGIGKLTDYSGKIISEGTWKEGKFLK